MHRKVIYVIINVLNNAILQGMDAFGELFLVPRDVSTTMCDLRRAQVFMHEPP